MSLWNRNPDPLNTFFNTAQPTMLSDTRHGHRGQLRKQLSGCCQDPEKAMDFILFKWASDLDSGIKEI